MGAIPKGEVDERSIADVTAGDLRGFTQCHFFAGIAGWPEALRRAGVPATRPLWTGSCPCQDFSCAGKRKGVIGHRDLWPEFFRLIRECRPVRVLGEQVSAAIGHGWLDRLSADLEAEGYAVGACVLGAHSAGADHIRQRIYWVANAESCGLQHKPMFRSAGVQHKATGAAERVLAVGGHGAGACGVADAFSERGRGGQSRLEDAADAGKSGQARNFWSDAVSIPCRDGVQRRAELGVFPLVDVVRRNMGRGGDSRIQMPYDEITLESVNATGEGRVMRLKGYGNAICVETAKLFIEECEDILK